MLTIGFCILFRLGCLFFARRRLIRGASHPCRRKHVSGLAVPPVGQRAKTQAGRSRQPNNNHAKKNGIRRPHTPSRPSPYTIAIAAIRMIQQHQQPHQHQEQQQPPPPQQRDSDDLAVGAIPKEPQQPHSDHAKGEDAEADLKPIIATLIAMLFAMAVAQLLFDNAVLGMMMLIATFAVLAAVARHLDPERLRTCILMCVMFLTGCLAFFIAAIPLFGTPEVDSRLSAAAHSLIASSPQIAELMVGNNETSGRTLVFDNVRSSEYLGDGLAMAFSVDFYSISRQDTQTQWTSMPYDERVVACLRDRDTEEAMRLFGTYGHGRFLAARTAEGRWRIVGAMSRVYKGGCINNAINAFITLIIGLMIDLSGTR